MTTVWTIFGLGLGFGLVAASFVWGIVLTIRYVLKRLKPWVHLPDEEGGMGFHGRAKVVDGHAIIGKGDDIKRYPIRVESRSATNDGIVYTIGKQTGANLRVPRTSSIRKALDGDPGAQLMFDTVDPGLLGRTYARRMAQETVDSNTEKEDWKKTAILPLSIVAGILALGLMGVAIKLAG